MDRSKKNHKIVKQEYHPESRQARIAENPASIYSMNPSWSFCLCDKGGRWAFTKERIGDEIWDKILPFLVSIGSQTWGEILLDAKKQHHTIPVVKLNKCAQKRLNDLRLYYDEVISLRLGGTIRIYGVWQVSTCCILWYDTDHGDNDTCVCRWRQKHT